MGSDQPKQVLRLPKKHAQKADLSADPDAGRRLWQAQSVRDAIVASLIVIVVFSTLWAMLSTLLGKLFPWFTLVLGFLLGLAVRRAGRGLDWRFPLIAAVATVVGSLVGNIVVAAAFTAGELDTGTLTILRRVSSLTWPVFFDEVMTAADAIYALAAACIAAFYANRRLNRAQYLAYRTWRERRDA